jgi:hypothetical protein
MLRRVVLVGTDVSEERSAFIVRVTSIGDLGTLMAAQCSSETSVLRRVTMPNIPEDGIIQSQVPFNPILFAICISTLSTG